MCAHSIKKGAVSHFPPWCVRAILGRFSGLGPLLSYSVVTVPTVFYSLNRSMLHTLLSVAPRLQTSRNFSPPFSFSFPQSLILLFQTMPVHHRYGYCTIVPSLSARSFRVPVFASRADDPPPPGPVEGLVPSFFRHAPIAVISS